MKRTVANLLILALPLLIRADEKEAEAQAKALLKQATRLVETMKEIKDRADAQKAKRELENIVSGFIKAQEGFRKLPRADREKIEATYAPKLEDVKAQFNRESERLHKTEGVMDVLGDLAPFKLAREARLKQAQLLVQSLDKALQIHKITTGEYPAKLEALAEGDKPLVEKKHLKDPWGRPFLYDVNGPKNKGNKPDVWSLGPPDKKDSLIGNWNAKPPTPPKDR
jgi:hypothetical protein